MKAKREIVVVYYEEDGTPKVLALGNGHWQFFSLKRMDRERVENLLGADEHGG